MLWFLYVSKYNFKTPLYGGFCHDILHIEIRMARQVELFYGDIHYMDHSHVDMQ